MDINKNMGVPDIQQAYALIFGQGLWTIGGSIVAFLVGQLVDVVIFHRILKITGDRFVWLRATASTAVSQLLDSFIVLYIAFVLGPQHWSIPQFLAVGTVNYIYKMCCGGGVDPVVVCGAGRHQGLSGTCRGRAAARRSRGRLIRASTFGESGSSGSPECVPRRTRPSLASATVSLRGSRMWPQPNIIRAAPIACTPLPPRRARRTSATPSHTEPHAAPGKSRIACSIAN